MSPRTTTTMPAAVTLRMTVIAAGHHEHVPRVEPGPQHLAARGQRDRPHHHPQQVDGQRALRVLEAGCHHRDHRDARRPPAAPATAAPTATEARSVLVTSRLARGRRRASASQVVNVGTSTWVRQQHQDRGQREREARRGDERVGVPAGAEDRRRDDVEQQSGGDGDRGHAAAEERLPDDDAVPLSPPGTHVSSASVSLRWHRSAISASAASSSRHARPDLRVEVERRRRTPTRRSMCAYRCGLASTPRKRGQRVDLGLRVGDHPLVADEVDVAAVVEPLLEVEPVADQPEERRRRLGVEGLGADRPDQLQRLLREPLRLPAVQATSRGDLGEHPAVDVAELADGGPGPAVDAAVDPDRAGVGALRRRGRRGSRRCGGCRTAA